MVLNAILWLWYMLTLYMDMIEMKLVLWNFVCELVKCLVLVY